MIRLCNGDFDEVCSLMTNESGIKEIFENKISRLYASRYSCIIKKDNITIGFINLVDEHIKGFLFLDMGIKEEYRGMGYGKEAINILLQQNIEEYIIGETKQINTSAIQVASDNGELFFSKNGFVYFIFPSTRKEELENDSRYKELLNHFGNVPNKRKILQGY